MCTAIRELIEEGIEDGEYKSLYELVTDGTITEETAAAKKNHTIEEFRAELQKRNLI